MKAIAILIAGVLGACTCGTLSRDELETQFPYAAGTLYSRGGFEPVLRELERRTGGPLVATSISINPGNATFRQLVVHGQVVRRSATGRHVAARCRG